MPIVSGDPFQAGTEIGRVVGRLRDRYKLRDDISLVRRALVFRDKSDISPQQAGTAIPSPYDESKLIYEYMGDLSDAAVFITNLLSENPPFFVVDPVNLGTGAANEVRLRKIAEDQQNFLNAEWWALTRRVGDIQRATAWGQAVDGVGWYYTVPRDHDFGLPSRQLFEEYTDDEIDELLRSGRALHTIVDDRRVVAETADAWDKRRKDQGRNRAIAGETLFTLDALADHLIYVDRDRDGIAIGIIREEIPLSTVGAGSQMAQLAADQMGDRAWAELGMMVDPETNQIVKGVGEGDATRYPSGVEATVTLNRIYTRDDITYTIGAAGAGGRPIFHTKHQMRRVPLEPVPYIDTFDARPERRYLSALDGAYAITPIINQTLTFLSSKAAYDAFPRWYIKVSEGRITPGTDGQPQYISREKAIGLDPQEVLMVEGDVQQMTSGDSSSLLNLLGFFVAAEDDAKPNDAERGSGSTSGAAWNIRLQTANAKAGRRAAQDGHARAVENVGLMWLDAARLLKEPFYFLPGPGDRSTRTDARGLIEINPEDLYRILQVVQSSNTIEEKATLAQVGESRRQQGFIDDYTLAKEFYERPNPRIYVMRMYVQAAVDAFLMGPNDRVKEGSWLWDLVLMARGLQIQRVLERVPNAAIAAAEFATVQGNRMQGSDSGFNRGAGGPTSEAVGARPPGVGGPTVQALPPGAAQ